MNRFGFIIRKGGVVPSSQTFNGNPYVGSTDGAAQNNQNFVVPAYNTLTLEAWGSGASGGAMSGASSYVAGQTGGGITVRANDDVTVLMRAVGGNGSANSVGGLGGASATCVGNFSTVSGTQGTSGLLFGSFALGGDGKSGANGGGAGTAGDGGVTVMPNPTAPGGSGGGLGRATASVAGPGGGGSAAYAKSVFVFGVTANAPAVGDTLHYDLGFCPAGKLDGLGGRSSGGAPNRLIISIT